MPANNATAAANEDSAAIRAKVRFDDIDIAILNQLQTDSKITNATLAQRVGISPPSTLERVKKLEAAGIIRQYAAILEPKFLGKSIQAIIHVSLREHGEKQMENFKDAVVGFDEVQSAWYTTGEEDFLIKILVSDMEQYEQFILHKLSAVPNIGRLRTSFCLSAVKDSTQVPLDAVAGGE